MSEQLPEHILIAIGQCTAAQKFLDAELLRLEGYTILGSAPAQQECRQRAHDLLDRLMDQKQTVVCQVGDQMKRYRP